MRAAGTETVTPHGLVHEAIVEKAELAERRASFDAEVEQRYARIVATGITIPWNTVRGYLEGKAIGKAVRRPALRRLAK